MDIFIQQLINGLVLGSIYALVALGYTMVYGILELINFAHGEVTMMGAMIAVGGHGHVLGAAPGIARAGVVAAGTVGGHSGLHDPGLHHRAGGLPAVTQCAAAGSPDHRDRLSIVLQNIAMMIWGTQYLPFPRILPGARHNILGAQHY